jgi:germacradienol/geosmin synthase
VDYLEMRRRTFGSDLTMSIGRLTRARSVPGLVFASRPMRELTAAASDYCCLINDVYSYQKEIEYEGELANGVLVVENFLACDRDQALAVVADLMHGRLRQFEHVATGEIPILAAEAGLDPGATEELMTYVEGIRDWMAAVLHWHRETRRYVPAELRYPLPRPILSSAPSQGWPGWTSSSPSRSHSRWPSDSSGSVPAQSAVSLGRTAFALNSSTISGRT